mgnify:CR=1 FL=1
MAMMRKDNFVEKNNNDDDEREKEMNFEKD